MCMYSGRPHRQHYMDPLCHYGATNTNHYAYLQLQPVNHANKVI